MLTRTNTKQLKAVAILLMLAHHLFYFSGPHSLWSVSGNFYYDFQY